MSYTPTVWDENTPITPARLNNLETQYELAVADAKVIKSIQTGETSLQSEQGYDEVNINAVNVSKSICFIAGKESLNADINDQNVLISLYDSTTLEISRQSTTGIVWIKWYVIEFY